MMFFWIVVLIAVILTLVWAVGFLRQMKVGLTRTGLSDQFTWGLYIQAFFFFSSVAGGILIFIGAAALFEVQALLPLVKTGAAVSLACLIAGGLSLSTDLGKPFRTLRIMTAKNFASPMTWDFLLLTSCVVLNLLLLVGLIPAGGPATTVWSVLILIAALGFVMIHTLFFLSRVGAGFRSQPFLGLDTLAQSLWGGVAVMTLIALATGFNPSGLSGLLLILTILTLMPQVGAFIASINTKEKGGSQAVMAYNTVVLIILLVAHLFSPGNPVLLTIAAILALVAVFLEKSHLVAQFQHTPTIPRPYSQFEEVPRYRSTASEWIMGLGMLGVCVLVSSVIIYWQGL